ncbi:tail fiber protein [Haloferula sargassicola]|uniref:Phage tail collar domain-containing protein n=1 Tax=Haloferula sargassicola TaxID=490096 RepID=A0ABP9UL21_9BACT
MKALLTSLLLALALPVAAQAPSLLSYQGRVSDASGNLIGSGSAVNRKVTFSFYASSTGGAPLYVETQTVTISGGEFSVLIGNGTGVAGAPGPSAPAVPPFITLPSIMNGDVYLGITVDDGTPAADAEITPRQQIVSGAYAFRAKVAEGLVDGALSTDMLADTSVTTNKIGSSQVTAAKIADSNIVTSKIADANITTVKLANQSVTSEKLAANAVTSSEIQDGSIRTADIGNGQINSALIANGSVASVDIADHGVATEDLADGAVTGAKVDANAIDYNKLAAAVQQALCPAGTILPYAGDNAPSGWLLCNGATVSRSTYSSLYSVVGNRFGSGNNSSTFHLPDFRGRFLRGRDGGAGRDPDRNSRGAMNGGGATGDAVGSVQGDMLQSHNHGYQDIYYSEGGGPVNVPDRLGSGDTDHDNGGYQISRTSSASGGNETRPTNANVNYIIKY